MDVLIGLIVIGAALWWLGSYAKAKQQKQLQKELQAKIDAQTNEARSYIERLNHSRAFPTVEMLNVNAQAGEFGLLHESTTLFELKSHRVGGGAGTRIKVGKVPIYLGGFQSTSVEGWAPAADGDLYLTNKRIVFVGSSRSVAIALKDLVGLDTELGSVRVHTAKRQKPYLFNVENSMLWSLLAKMATSGELASPQMPSGLQLDVSASQNGGNAELRITPHGA